MDPLSTLIPTMPLLAASLIGLGHLFCWIEGERSENFTALVATWTLSMTCLLAFALLIADFMGLNSGRFELGPWLESDTFKVDLQFTTSGFNVHLAAQFAILLLVIVRFSVNYLHREPGFHRFFFVYCLFAAGMFLLVLSGNALFTFIGWEIAGLCSYFLIAYAYDRPNATANATRVFVTNRIGDAAFLLGLGLSSAWAETLAWTDLNAKVPELGNGEGAAIGLCFAVAALTKSAQLPFSPWLGRAMEGPTPSSAAFYSAVMIHSGVFLMISLQAFVDQIPLVAGLLVVSGMTTAIYSYFSGLVQTDVKSSHVFATMGQLGLMFVECGLGFWQLASWHLFAHAIVRCYLVLSAPSFIHQVKSVPVKPVSSRISKHHWLFVAAMQRFWVEAIADFVLVKPVRHLGRDLSYFDDNVVDRLMGIPAPAINAASSLAQWEEKALSANSENSQPSFSSGVGLLSRLGHRLATWVHWFEDRLVLKGIGTDMLHLGRELGHLANKFENQVLRPRYLVLLVFITLLLAA